MEKNEKLTDGLDEAYALVGQIDAIAQVIASDGDAPKMTQDLAFGINSLTENLGKVIIGLQDIAEDIEKSLKNMVGVV